jgi:hypothetical protein
MAEVETNGTTEASLLIPCIKSLKRTYDLFLTNQLNPRALDDLDSQRIKVYSKVQDEYAMVRDMPPPAPPSRAVTTTTSTSTSTSVVTTGTTETALALPPTSELPYGEIRDEETQIKVVGGHSYPSGPGS